jgi:hypothetical protein
MRLRETIRDQSSIIIAPSVSSMRMTSCEPFEESFAFFPLGGPSPRASSAERLPGVLWPFIVAPFPLEEPFEDPWPLVWTVGFGFLGIGEEGTSPFSGILRSRHLISFSLRSVLQAGSVTVHLSV